MFQKKIRISNPGLIKEIGKQPCAISARFGVDVHHVKSKKSGGHDLEWNLCPLIHELHVECHAIGLQTFAKKYVNFRNWLLSNGWSFDAVKSKWIHYIDGEAGEEYEIEK